MSFVVLPATSQILTRLNQTFGKIYTFFDVKWTYLSALVLFEGERVISRHRGTISHFQVQLVL